MTHSDLKIRLLHRCIVAFAALATLVVPAAGPMLAHAGPGGRTLLMSVCTSQGAGIQAEVLLPGGPPLDRGTDGACHQCPLCVPGADRPLAGPLPAGIVVPVSFAKAERPAARPRTRNTSGPGRASRARDPPSLS